MHTPLNHPASSLQPPTSRITKRSRPHGDESARAPAVPPRLAPDPDPKGGDRNRLGRPLGSPWSPLIPPTAPVDAIGCPANAGPAEPPTWAEHPFKGRLGSELRWACSGRGSQSAASPPWRPPSTYSSPSQPLLHLIVHYIIRKSPVLSSSTGSPSPSIGFRARLQYTIKEAVIFLRASLR